MSLALLGHAPEQEGDDGRGYQQADDIVRVQRGLQGVRDVYEGIFDGIAVRHDGASLSWVEYQLPAGSTLSRIQKSRLYFSASSCRSSFSTDLSMSLMRMKTCRYPSSTWS